MNAIEITNLHKSYEQTEVLKGINLTVPQGSLLALLGPNGAGKTTTVRILATLLQFNSGSVKVFGHDVIKDAQAVRHHISLTGQFASVDDDLTGLENLILIARLRGFSWRDAHTRAVNLLKEFELENAMERRVKQYSGGMRRRLDIAASVVVLPRLLFLDEPTTGLDPRSRRQIWEMIQLLQEKGTTVLLTTQYLEEADALADRIIIMDDGQIIADGTGSQLKALLGSSKLHIRLQHVEKRSIAQAIIAEIPNITIHLQVDPLSLSVQGVDSEQVLLILTTLTNANIQLAEFALGQPNLDDVFLSLTKA